MLLLCCNLLFSISIKIASVSVFAVYKILLHSFALP